MTPMTSHHMMHLPTAWILAYESVKMVGIYFSGTGNSKYAVELFCKEYDNESRTYSIEDTEALTAVTEADL